MSNAPEQRRERWLRRTSLITGWIAALAVAATLLIAAVVSSASPAKKVAIAVHRPAARPAQVRHRAAVVLHRRRVVRVARVHRTVHVAKKVAQVTPPPAPTPTPPPAPPAPAPVTPPVVVSGGS